MRRPYSATSHVLTISLEERVLRGAVPVLGAALKNRGASVGKLGDVTENTATDLLLDITALRRTEGASDHIARRVTTAERLGPEMIAIPAGGEVDLDVTLVSVAEGIYVTGTADAAIAGTCVRCLEDIQGTFHTEIAELFTFPERAAELRAQAGDLADELDEGYLVTDDDAVDLTQLLIDEAGLNLPFSPDCASVENRPCATDLAAASSADGSVTAKAATADGEADTTDVVDPRWAALAGFTAEPTADDDAQDADGTAT